MSVDTLLVIFATAAEASLTMSMWTFLTVGLGKPHHRQPQRNRPTGRRRARPSCKDLCRPMSRALSTTCRSPSSPRSGRRWSPVPLTAMAGKNHPAARLSLAFHRVVVCAVSPVRVTDGSFLFEQGLKRRTGGCVLRNLRVAVDRDRLVAYDPLHRRGTVPRVQDVLRGELVPVGEGHVVAELERVGQAVVSG